MQVLFENDGRNRELDIQVNNPSATVTDLAKSLDPIHGQQRRLWVGDRVVDPDIELRDAGLHEGAVVSFDHQAPQQHMTTARREVVVANGLNAGHRIPLFPGDVLIGRDSQCHIPVRDGSVSRRHAVLRTNPEGVTTIEDLGSSNGTHLGWNRVTTPMPVPDDVPISIGAAHLVVRTVRSGDRPMAVDPLRYTTAAGTIPFNRPPRPAPPPEPEEIRPPDPPKPTTSRSPFSIIAMIGPIVMGVAMYKLIGSKLFLMFALLSPIMAVGRFIDNKRKGKKSERSENERYARELKDCQRQVRERAEQERVLRDEQHPDVAEIMRRVESPSTMLWERRPEHEDFLHLRAGVGQLPWEPPLKKKFGSELPPEELTAMLQQESMLYDTAIPLDLSGGNVVGIVGDRRAALALARSLVCQAAVLHGPADLPIMVLASATAAPFWDWAKWFPHTRSAGGDNRMLSGDPELSAQMAESFISANQQDGSTRASKAPGQKKETGPTMFVVVDDETLTEGRRAPVRNLLRGDASLTTGVVVASSADRLPALCTSVIQLNGLGGDARMDLPQEGAKVDWFVACGMSDQTARDCARGLARFEDPELEIVGAGLPGMIRLLPLLELDECTPPAILTRWKSAGVDPSPAGPIGVSETGTFHLDFMTDGPHGLVGGTTGAGKSELLRSMVAGMAASVDPDHLTFLLVDFKGGSAFDQCAELPHTVAMVTDLDEHLAQRALQCLEAELKYRERALRDAGASDLVDYLRNAKGTDPLPRLLVVIDEFATLKAELPEFIDALVGVAQRGRSLGVHMLLATQRPQGAISENIKANTNMRIALRMQDKSDSNDVIGIGDAADIPRGSPGRAYVRLGPSEVVAIQSALSTGDRNEGTTAALEIAPFIYGPVSRQKLPKPPTPGGEAGNGDGAKGERETDLSVLVDTINKAFVSTGRPAPRRPMPEPLPADLDLDPLVEQALADTDPGTPASFVPVALADDPDNQSQYPAGWAPGTGNLLVYGLVGSGTTTALASLALSMARLYSPEQLHLYVIDFGAGELAPLAGLPHCGGFVQSHENERQQRWVRFLRSELDRRKQLSPADRRGLPTIVSMVDGWPAFIDEYQDIGGQELIDALIRVCADGPEVGLYMIIVSERSAGISNKIVSTTRQRWAFKMADPNDFNVVGVRSRAVPEMLPGHALVSEVKQLVHIGRPSDGLVAAVDRLRAQATEPSPERAPYPILTLPHEVPSRELGAAAQLSKRPWVVPVGIAEADLQAASLVLYEGEHALIAGPARSGKSSALLTVADVVLAAEPEAHIAAVATSRSPLFHDSRIHRVIDPEDIGELQKSVETPAPVVLILIDDAEAIDESRLDSLGTSRRPNLLAVAAGRSDMLRSNFKHWTRNLRRAKTGVLLMPDPNLDGELLGCRVPRRVPVAMTAGRGFVVNSGDPGLAQVAKPEPPSTTTRP